jgi:hypothetical protein
MTHITQPSNGGGLARPPNELFTAGQTKQTCTFWQLARTRWNLDSITVSAPTAPEIRPCNRSSEQPTAGSGVGCGHRRHCHCRHPPAFSVENYLTEDLLVTAASRIFLSSLLLESTLIRHLSSALMSSKSSAG